MDIVNYDRFSEKIEKFYLINMLKICYMFSNKNYKITN